MDDTWKQRGCKKTDCCCLPFLWCPDLLVQILCVEHHSLLFPLDGRATIYNGVPWSRLFIRFETKPAASVWSRWSRMDINQSWAGSVDPTSSHLAMYSQESFIVLQILKDLTCSQIGTFSSLFSSFRCILSRASRGWHLLSSCCLSMWCLLGKDGSSIWRFWRGLCPCSLFRGLRGVSYCEIRWRLSLASGVMATE